MHVERSLHVLQINKRSKNSATNLSIRTRTHWFTSIDYFLSFKLSILNYLNIFMAYCKSHGARWKIINILKVLKLSWLGIHLLCYAWQPFSSGETDWFQLTYRWINPHMQIEIKKSKIYLLIMGYSLVQLIRN